MTLDELHRSRVGKVSDKWSSYLSYYDQLFSTIKNEKINILEVGVQNGGSIETWVSYFTQGQNFIGCDINPKCSELTFTDDRIKLIIGDINNEDTFNKIKDLNLSFDIIIDDGSHLSKDIISSFLLYFPLIKPGGIYIVEDTHTLYQEGNFSAQKFFYNLVDVLSHEFWPANFTLQAIFNPVPSFIADGWADEISFRNSLVTIHKAKAPGHHKLGDRVIAGQEDLVQNLDHLKIK